MLGTADEKAGCEDGDRTFHALGDRPHARRCQSWEALRNAMVAKGVHTRM